MKYPCAIINDLLPLYADGVCSEESRQAVMEHLKDCACCRKEYEKMELYAAQNKKYDSAQAKLTTFISTDSLIKVRRELLIKRILTAAVAVLLVIGLTAGAGIFMKNNVHSVVYNPDSQNIRVVQEPDGDIIARLYGTEWESVYSRTIELEDGQNAVIFSMTSSSWDDLMIGDNTASEYLIAGNGKDVGQIEQVYFLSQPVNELSYDQLTQLFANHPEQFTLLWEKQ